MLFLSCFIMLSCTSVFWCRVVTCWEGADLSALVLKSYCDVVTFIGSGVVLACIDS